MSCANKDENNDRYIGEYIMQKGREDPNLYNASRKDGIKQIDYYNTYIKNFLSEDPVKDGESIKGCKELGNFFLEKVGNNVERITTVLDAGTKDAQFPEWLNNQNFIGLGLEIDPNYIKYAESKDRPIKYGDVCNINFPDNSFDVIFAHHVLGLCPSYEKAYQEMLRVADKYIVTLNQVPGNPKKHYSLINNKEEVKRILEDCPTHKVVYFDFGKRDELVTILSSEKE